MSIFPKFFAFHSECPRISPALVVVNKGTAEKAAILQVRTAGDQRLSEASLTREETLGVIAALREALDLPPEAA